MVSRCLILGLLVLAGVRDGQAQDSTARPTGLPGKVRWTFNLDAGFGVFGFNNSLFTDARPDPSGDLSDNWMESYVRPAISGVLTTGKSEFFGTLSAAGERTFAAPPPLIGGEASSFQADEALLGWRSGTALGTTENMLELTVGRARYQLGQGLLVWDGGGEGGSRGGYWSNARRAWQFAGIAAITLGTHHKLEGFYLDRDDTPESETGTRLWGGNYELSLGDATTIGASYLKVEADPDELPGRDGMSVYNVRLYTAPFQSVPGLTFEGEYAREKNGELLASTGWTAQGGYEFDTIGWSPRLSYRYTYFQGDDPVTAVDETFDMLFPGFYDWGTWWQGEIAGEYFLANSNLISHQVRLHLTPSDRLSGGLIGYIFQLDQPASFAPGVTSRDIASELDLYADWQVNSNFTISLLAAWADPREAVEQGFQRTSPFSYGMVYVAYGF